MKKYAMKMRMSNQNNYNRIKNIRTLRNLLINPLNDEPLLTLNKCQYTIIHLEDEGEIILILSVEQYAALQYNLVNKSLIECNFYIYNHPPVTFEPTLNLSGEPQ